MTREIVFRGKRIDTGEWVYGDLIENQGRYYIYYATSDTTLENEDNSIIVLAEEVNLDTVGQYTGLKDRNGKEIWEGDIIVQQGYSGMRPMLVRFDSGAFITGSHKGSSTPKRPMLIQPRCKIIGNIYDNPELLED